MIYSDVIHMFPSLVDDPDGGSHTFMALVHTYILHPHLYQNPSDPTPMERILRISPVLDCMTGVDYLSCLLVMAAWANW